MYNSYVLCSSLLNNEMHRDARCAHLRGGGRCGFFDGFPTSNTRPLELEPLGREELIPGLEIEIPFPYSRDAFYNIDTWARFQLLPLYDRFVAFGETDFHEALERTYHMAEAEFQHKVRCNKNSDSFEQMYEKLQFIERWKLAEPVRLIKDDDYKNAVRCGFHQSIFDNGFKPGPFPGLEFYTKNGRFVTAEQIEWLKSAAEGSSGVFLGPYGYDKCPIRFMDILQAQMMHGRFGAATYAIEMANWDTCGPDEDGN